MHAEENEVTSDRPCVLPHAAYPDTQRGALRRSCADSNPGTSRARSYGWGRLGTAPSGVPMSGGCMRNLVLPLVPFQGRVRLARSSFVRRVVIEPPATPTTEKYAEE